MMNMKKTISLLVLCLTVLWVGVSIAQTLTTDAPAGQKVWEVFLKVLFPTLWTAVSPFFTKFVSIGLLKIMSTVHPSLQVVISSILGGLMAGLAGTIDGFPLGVESAATMGIAGGATGQLLANMNPHTVQPQQHQVP